VGLNKSGFRIFDGNNFSPLPSEAEKILIDRQL